MAWGTVTVGRLELRETWTASRGADGKLSLSGQESNPPLTTAAVRQRAEDLAGLAGALVPVAFTDKPDLDGYYRVESAEVEHTDYQGEVVTAGWTLELSLAGRAGNVELESRLTGATRATEHATAPERWHAPPAGHHSYYLGANTPTTMTRVGEDGPITVYQSVPASVDPRWGCPVGDYFGGAVRLLDDGVARSGTALAVPDGWVLTNGLVRVSLGDGATLDVAAWTGGGWRSKAWNVQAGGVDLGVWDAVTLLRNDPEQVIARLVGTAAGVRVTLDLGLRRGSRFVEGHLQRAVAGTLAVDLDVAEDAVDNTATGGYTTASADDADGNQFVAGSAAEVSAATNGGITLSATTGLDFFVGVAPGGTVLNTNTGFEVDTAGWAATDCTLERSVEQAHAGTASGKVTPDDEGEVFVYISGDPAPVVEGQQYVGSAWVYSAAGGTEVSPNLNWFDGSAAYMSTTSDSTVVPAGWSFLTCVGTAPAGAASANVSPTISDNPTAADVVYVDEVKLRPVTAAGDAAAVLAAQYLGALAESTSAVRR
jgi:hypothetical protein